MNVSEWKLIERERISDVLEEQEFQGSGSVDAETAVRIGRILGADGVIVGTVAQYRIGSLPFIFMFVCDMDIYKVDYSFRLVDVQSSEICLAAQASAMSCKSFEDALKKTLDLILAKIQ